MENNNSMAELLEQFEKDFVVPKKGELVKGKVVSVSDKEIVVNIGYKADGIIPKSEVSNNDVNLTDFTQEGQELEVYILKKDDGDGNVLLSLKRISQLKDWTELEKLAEEATIITVTIKEAVKGGVIAYYNEIRGFIPASQIAPNPVESRQCFFGTHLPGWMPKNTPSPPFQFLKCEVPEDAIFPSKDRPETPRSPPILWPCEDS